MKRQTLHMIGNAHLDPVWLWRWQEGFQETKATFRSVLTLMDESDDFVFTSSSAALYEWVERNDPDLFAGIKRRVAEGRWEIVGGWWIQADCNLPSGESFARQGLYGQRYFKEKLGVTATVGYSVDSFGHHAMLPQILHKSGLDSYIFMRPQPHEQGLPARLFWWESDDGSRVLTFRIPFEYQTWDGAFAQHVRLCASELAAPVDEVMCFYGVGNHGGGPTRENLEAIRALARDPAMPALTLSTPGRFFARVRARDLPIPVVHDELQHHASGCYAAHSGIKRWNRKAEVLLVSAERFSTLALRLTGQPYPDDFAHAWKGVLFNQFHDILAGTSIEPAYDDAHDLYGEAMAIAARNLNDALQSISWRVNIVQDEGGYDIPIVAFNPHAWPARVPVEVEIGRLPDDASLVDDAGAPVPMQLVRSLATVSGGRHRVLFMADLPSFGYRTYRLVARHAPAVVPLTTSTRRVSGEAPPDPPSGEAPPDPPSGEAPPDPPSGEAGAAAGDAAPPDPSGDDDTYTLENGRFRLRVDPASGCIVSLYDKRARFEVLRGEGLRAVVLADPSDTWGHGVTRFDHPAGEFAVRSVRRIEHGPVRSTLRVESVYDASRLVQEVMLYRDLEVIEVRITVDWRQQFEALKLRLPLNLSRGMKATYEIPYGHIDRPTDGEEEPGQSWIDLTGVARGTDDLYGLSILNDGKYSFDVHGHELGLTVLRSPIYAHHTPYVPRPDEEYSFIDQGLQQFTYGLVPHQGGWEEAGTVRRAAELNAPPIALLETYHAGPLGLAGSYLTVDQESVVVDALKRAEDADGVVVRCHETAGRAVRATLRLPLWDRTIEADFAPCELKTFHLPDDPALPVREVSLIEWDL